jgi:hypothetical protein
MEKTWMSLTAGILDIICGSIAILILLVLMIVGGISGIVMPMMPRFPELMPALLWWLSIPAAIIAILAITGGICSLQRKNWGLALAGSIAAFFPLWLLGIAAIVLTVLSKEEFK